jgi:hypothetical protein
MHPENIQSAPIVACTFGWKVGEDNRSISSVHCPRAIQVLQGIKSDGLGNQGLYDALRIEAVIVEP